VIRESESWLGIVIRCLRTKNIAREVAVQPAAYKGLSETGVGHRIDCGRLCGIDSTNENGADRA
jgi:hypothetical protein